MQSQDWSGLVKSWGHWIDWTGLDSIHKSSPTRALCGAKNCLRIFGKVKL